MEPAARRGRMTAVPGAVRPIVIAHRGASGYHPEHTLAAYELGVRMGADLIETDLVVTADGQLAARHEPELSLTTDIAERPEFADRRATRSIDGLKLTGWFAEDLTLAEVAGLRAVERMPAVRRANTLYDRRYPVPTLDEILALRVRLSAELGREIGLCVETKHETYFAAQGRPPEPVLVEALRAAGLAHAGAPVLLMSFEPTTLRTLGAQVDVPLVQLLEPVGAPADLLAAGDPRDYAALATDAGLAEIATYAEAIGPAKAQVISGDATGPTGLVDRAHAVGLRVFPYTYRNENLFLPPDLRSGSDASDYGDAFAEYAAHIAAGVDGLITDHPDTAVAARSMTPNPVQRVAPGDATRAGSRRSAD